MRLEVTVQQHITPDNVRLTSWRGFVTIVVELRGRFADKPARSHVSFADKTFSNKTFWWQGDKIAIASTSAIIWRVISEVSYQRTVLSTNRPVTVVELVDGQLALARLYERPTFGSLITHDVCRLLLLWASELWCLSGGKRGYYQNCSVLYCVHPAFIR